MVSKLQSDEVFLELVEKKKEIDDRRQRGLEKRAFSKYRKMKKRGGWYFFVPEFDAIMELELEEQHKNKRRLDNMAKYELECSMTKGFNRVAVNIREIEEQELPEFQQTIVKDTERLWKQMPHSDVTSKTEHKVKTVQQNNNRVEAQTNTNYDGSSMKNVIELADIPFPTKDSGQQGYIGTLGQHKTLVSLYNQKKINWDDIKRINSYGDLTKLMDKAFGKR